MSVLSLRVDESLKSALESEANKQGISLSSYIKKSLKNGLLNTHISNAKSDLSDTKSQIKKLAKISDEAINEVENKIKRIGQEAERNKYTKQVRKMYWILISVSTLFVLVSIPVLLFSVKYLNFVFE